MPFVSINPASGERIATYKTWSDQQLDEVVASVSTCGRDWSNTSFEERAKVFRAVAAILRARANDLARLMALEMGKPVTSGQAEIEKCASVCEFYAQHAERFLEVKFAHTDASRSYVHYLPLGTILAVMPWNFPFWQVFRFGAPALMAGNTVLMKHAENVTGCALEIERIFKEAGLLSDVYRSLLIEVGQVERLIRSPLIAAVTLTGSERAGRIVAGQAGRELKPSVLELGGSDPFIVLPDANLEEAARVGAIARTVNSGQSCVAAKRFIVATEVYEKFLRCFVDHMRQRILGDPMNPATDIGPQAREDLRENLHAQVHSSVAHGAKVVLGGDKPAAAGFFYPATVLTEVASGMRVYDEEVFGPAAAVIKVETIDEAIRVANDTRYGLGASIWTSTPRAFEGMAKQIQAGMVFFNGLVKTDPRLPTGGTKASGYGRELSVQGIRAFVNTQTVWIA